MANENPQFDIKPEAQHASPLDLSKFIAEASERSMKEHIRRTHNGWIGDGPYTSKHRAYRPWRNMIGRKNARHCPDKWARHVPNCLNGMVVDWMNFQDFAEWCEAQKEFSNLGWQLDKDLFCVSYRLYGPDTCCFLPPEINRLIRLYDPRKVTEQWKRSGKWKLKSKKYARRVGKNEFKTREEAYFAFIDALRVEVIGLAAKQRDKFSDRVYEQLVTGYWLKLKEYMTSVEGVCEVMTKAEQEVAMLKH